MYQHLTHSDTCLQSIIIYARNLCCVVLQAKSIAHWRVYASIHDGFEQKYCLTKYPPNVADEKYAEHLQYNMLIKNAHLIKRTLEKLTDLSQCLVISIHSVHYNVKMFNFQCKGNHACIGKYKKLSSNINIFSNSR